MSSSRFHREHDLARDRSYAGNITPECSGRGDTARSLLGAAQKRWLNDSLAASVAC